MGNRFEDKEYLGIEQPIHEPTLERISPRLIYSVQLGKSNLSEIEKTRLLRSKEHTGTEPSEVWGEDAGKLCGEFMQFAGKYSVGQSTLVKSQQIMHADQNHTERVLIEPRRGLFTPARHAMHFSQAHAYFYTSGFALAYSHEAVSQKQRIAELVIGSDGTKIGERNPDVFLCADGLLRKGWLPLDITEDGTPETPQFGTWDETCVSVPYLYSFSGEGGLEESQTRYRADTRYTFKATDTVSGLARALQDHARDIHLSTDEARE